jgi:hypothetical protein
VAPTRRGSRTPSPLRSVRLVALALVTVLAGCTADGTDEVDEPDEAEESEEAEEAEPEAAGIISDLALCLVGEDDCPAEREDAEDTGILCTGTVSLDDGAYPGALDGLITVDGETLLRTAVTGDEVAARDGDLLSLRFVLGVPMPAGDYGCRFEVGGQVTEAERTLDGDEATFWEHRVCDRAEALELSPGVLACPTDTDALPETTTGVACTTGVRPDGQLVVLTYEAELDEGDDLEPVTREIDAGELPLAAANGAADAVLFGRESGDPLPNGEHTCRFELEDGSESYERTFTIGPIDEDEETEGEDDETDADEADEAIDADADGDAGDEATGGGTG